MKNYLLLLLCFTVSLISTAQVGIGNTDPKAILDISASNPSLPSNTDGLLIPRIDAFPLTAPTADQDGMLVYLTISDGSSIPGIYSWNNASTSWLSLMNIKETVLEDTDTDTRIQVEESADEDIIRFDIAGTEYLRLEAGRLQTSNTNNNVFFGINAGSLAATGGRNTAFGTATLRNLTTGAQNVAIGDRVLHKFTAGSYNIGIGSRTMNEKTGGSHNIVLGRDALYENTTGSNNIAIGEFALGDNVTGSSNVAIGPYAGRRNLGSKSVFIGDTAGAFETNSFRLYIDNSNTSSPLIYGEFDNDLLRVNGTLDINNAYQLPIADGTSGQLLSTDGAGNVVWMNDMSGTDDQNIAGSGLSGTDLTIGIEGGISEVIDLSSLQNGLFEITSNVVQPNSSINDGTADFLFGYHSLDQSGNSSSNKFYFDKSKGAFRAGKTESSYWNQVNTGLYSAAFGDGTRANGLSSMAWGYYSEAMGDYSTAGGSGIANGAYSAAWGQGMAEGDFSTAWGYLNTAWDDYATVWGYDNTADGDYTTVWGYGSQADGDYGTVWGYNVRARSAFETAFGRYNTIVTPNSSTAWNAADRLLVIGNGTNSSNRSNALTIYKNGTMNINDAYDMPTTDGASGQVMTTDGAGVVSWASNVSVDMEDSDGDTTIQVEESADEDIIRFDVAGTEYFRMNTGRFETVNTGGSVIIGENAGLNDDLTNRSNVFIGSSAGKENVRGYQNIALGLNALTADTDGFNNIAMGTGTMISSIGATNNVAIGENALSSLVGGSNNIAIGTDALESATGSTNIGIGQWAGKSNTGSRNIFIGHGAGDGDTSSSNKLFIGLASVSSFDLIYGEFDNELLRVNGTLDIFGQYQFPIVDGTAGQALTTDGSGNVNWTTPSATFEVVSNLVKPSNLVNMTTTDFVFGSPQLNDNGNANHDRRFFFDKSQGSLRAGYVNGNHWNEANIGDYSFATGFNTIASGSQASAWGSLTTASGFQATAFGNQTRAGGTYATSWGNNTNAAAYATTVWGRDSYAAGSYATAWGYSTRATGSYSTAWGNDTEATGHHSTAWGADTFAPSAFETAFGQYNTEYTPASNTNWNDSDRLLTIGNGPSYSNRSDALIVLKNGTITAPSLDISEITDDRALVTKEYVEVEAETTSINFASNWSQYGGDWERVTYYKDRDRVYIDGLANKNSSITISNDHIFTLPVGYRPARKVIASGQQTGNTLRVEVHADGRVFARDDSGVSPQNYVSLSGVSFRIN